MLITKEQLKTWNACRQGYEWFLKSFPQGGKYSAVYSALISDSRIDDADWLVNRAYEIFLAKKDFIAFEQERHGKMIEELTSMEHPTSDVDVGSSGDEAQIGSSGDEAQIGSSGDEAQIGSSGFRAQIGSSGFRAQIGSSGFRAQIGSSGFRAQIGSSGDEAKIEVTGKDAVVAAAGSVESIILGEGGCAAIPYKDAEGRTRFALAYVGESGIEAGVAYQVNEAGQFVEVKK